MTRFNERELEAFNRYTNLLRELVVKEQGSYDGIAMNSAKCSQCARDVPAGIPRQLRGTDRVLCPACVKHRVVVPALTRELHGSDGAKAITKGNVDSTELKAEIDAAIAKTRAERAAANPPRSHEQRLAKLAGSIARLEASVAEAPNEEEREARRRIVAAAIAGYRKQSGGFDPPPTPHREK